MADPQRFSTSSSSRSGWVGFSFRSNLDDLESSRLDRPSFVSSSKADCMGGFNRTDPPEIGLHGSGRVCPSDEDVNISDRDDGDSGRVFSNRHPEVIR
jgi:hypothetical protein